MALKDNDVYHREIVTEISKEQDMDRRVVDFIATHPFLFISRIMRNVLDLKSIMVRYFGKFAIRSNSKKTKAQKELQPLQLTE